MSDGKLVADICFLLRKLVSYCFGIIESWENTQKVLKNI